MRIETAFTVFTPTISAEFPVDVLVGFDCDSVPDGRLVELPRLKLETEVEVEPVPFSLIAFLTNAPKFSQSESFALMAPTPP